MNPGGIGGTQLKTVSFSNWSTNTRGVAYLSKTAKETSVLKQDDLRENATLINACCAMQICQAVN